MKKTLLFIALVLGAGNFAFAQTAVQPSATKSNAAAVKATPEERIDHQLQKMTKALNLTAQQQVSIKQILIQAEPGLKTAKQNNDMAAVKQKKDDVHAQVIAILTPDQRTKMKELMDSRESGKATQKTTQNMKAN